MATSIEERIEELTGKLGDVALGVYQGWAEWIQAIAYESERRGIPTETLTQLNERVYFRSNEEDIDITESDRLIFKQIDNLIKGVDTELLQQLAEAKENYEIFRNLCPESVDSLELEVEGSLIKNAVERFALEDLESLEKEVMDAIPEGGYDVESDLVSRIYVSSSGIRYDLKQGR